MSETGRKNRGRKAKLSFYGYILCVCSTLVDGRSIAQTDELDPPEIAIQKLQTDLANIELQLSGSAIATDRQSIAAQKFSADALYVEASNNFLKGEFSTCIRQLNSYLNLTQDPKPDLHLKAQHMLGFSYEQTGNKDRAVRAYMRYIEVQSTTSDVDREKLIEVIRRTLELSATMPTYPVSEKAKIFSAITGQKLKDFEKAELLLYAARNASALISTEQAAAWLLEARSLASKQKELMARIDYELASIYASAKNTTLAEERLALVKQDLGDTRGELYDLANLTLARLHYKGQNPRLALTLYETIGDSSPYYRTSLYERVFAYAEAKQSEKALTAAESYLQLFGSTPDATTVRAYLALLQLEANKSEKAEESINEAINALVAFHHALTEQRDSRRGFDETFLSDVIRRQLISVNSGSLSMFVIQTSKSLNKLDENLKDTEQQLYRQLFALSQLNPYEIRPEWGVRATQLSSLSLQTFSVANKLMAIAQSFSGKNLDPIAQAQLVNSQEKRRQLLSSIEGLRRQRISWSEWSNFLNLAKMLNLTLSKINQTRAEIAALRANAKSDTALSSKLEEDLKANQELASRAITDIRNLHSLKIKKLHRFSPHQDDIKLYHQYMDQLHSEFAIIDHALDLDTRYALRYTKNDFRETWEQWQRLAQRIQKSYDEFDEGIQKDLGQKSDAIIALYETFERSSDLRSLAASAFERLRMKKSPEIYAELSTRAANELSRYRKWLADLDWLKANNLEDEKATIARQLAIDFETMERRMESTK